MIEKILMNLTFFLCKILFKKHGKKILLFHGTKKDEGKQLIYSEIPTVTKGLLKLLETPISERLIEGEIGRSDTEREILFYALKQLELEINIAKESKNYQTQDELETKYSYWKQLMAG